jgi:hypothetical protein
MSVTGREPARVTAQAMKPLSATRRDWRKRRASASWSRSSGRPMKRIKAYARKAAFASANQPCRSRPWRNSSDAPRSPNPRSFNALHRDCLRAGFEPHAKVAAVAGVSIQKITETRRTAQKLGHRRPWDCINSCAVYPAPDRSVRVTYYLVEARARHGVRIRWQACTKG